MKYEDLIKQLKNKVPEPKSPGRLTDKIMKAVELSSDSHTAHFSIKVTQGQWQVISIVRNVLSIAALFLIVFFVLEQHALNTRLSKLETGISDNPVTNYADAAKFYQINEIIRQTIPIDSLQDVIQINRRSLSYLLKQISDLEVENITFREKLQQYYIDSTKLHKSINDENK